MTNFYFHAIIAVLSASKMRSNPTRREAEPMFYIITFLLFVAAGIVSYYICKWLDSVLSDNQHKNK